ncbi:putative transcription regulator BDF1 [Aspergillus lucknowensis]|uniref:Bromodomain-containing protein n=1 Tax=Aspergillus lucknowensis TaxID=176173 RepID=A0ABR4LEC1_9EURO
MATPPPEASSVFKEEKPQLPPSPNGDTSSHMDRLEVVTDPKLIPPTNGAETSEKDFNGASANGHPPDQRNGVATTTSPPKSPTLLATETDSPQEKPFSTSPVANLVSFEDKPSSFGEATKQSINGAGIDSSGLDDTLTVHMASDTAASVQSPQSTNLVKNELPHHPSTTQPNHSSNEDVDQVMRDSTDVPASPPKMSRERDDEPNDEPSAKRTKIDTEGLPEFKVPELPTPATEGTADAVMDGNTTITKVQHKFLLKSIQSLKRMHDARFYKEPVDPIKMNIPHYPQVIKQPMDLTTMEQKLKNNAYKDPQAVADDFHLMLQNAETFNGTEHIVSKEGQKLKATFQKQMTNLPKPDELEEKKPKKVAAKTSAARREPRSSAGQNTARATGGSPQATTTFALGPEGLPVIRRDSTNADGRPKRSIHPPKRDLPYSTKPKKKKYQWELKFCQEVVDELHKPKNYYCAAPFYIPVDPVALNIPTYHSIIKKPMDLSTVQTKLNTGQYENAKEFEADIRQIVKNCLKFNLKGDPTYVAGEQFEEIFNLKWSQKDSYLAAHEPHPEQHSAESSSDESDEDDEPSDDEEEEAINRLKKQIAEMSQQLEAMTQKKKKTPPTSKKTKPKKKDNKKSGSASSGKKDKKSSSKSAKPEKQRWVSYHEKQIISNGISSLPDKKMQEALKIIQSNVPALKGTQETEIELDIDELPNEVLLMLLKFVKKNAPHIVDDEDVSTPIASNAPPAKPKKNKPMSKYEQEAQINMLESNLSRFQGGGSGRSPDPVPSVEANDSSDDSEDDSEESEEE